MAAIVGLLMAKLNAGDEVVFFDECYHRSREFCTKHLSRFGVVTRQVPACDYDAMEAAITPRTRLLVSESPTNPHLSVVDLERFADIGRRNNIETLIDATLGTPYNMRPLAAGIDYVLHSATKYLGGHNDLLAGVVIGTAEKLEPVRKLRGIMGAINSPHNIYSAAARAENVRTADAAAQRERPGGRRVPGNRIRGSKRCIIRACRRTRITKSPSARCAASAAWSRSWCRRRLARDRQGRRRVQIPRIAPSLGGVESLIEQPLVMSYYECTPEDRRQYGIPDNMIRLSCGIENTEDLVADLKQALEA